MLRNATGSPRNIATKVRLHVELSEQPGAVRPESIRIYSMLLRDRPLSTQAV
jgi:hypothetical protein